MTHDDMAPVNATQNGDGYIASAAEITSMIFRQTHFGCLPQLVHVQLWTYKWGANRRYKKSRLTSCIMLFCRNDARLQMFLPRNWLVSRHNQAKYSHLKIFHKRWMPMAFQYHFNRGEKPQCNYCSRKWFSRWYLWSDERPGLSVYNGPFKICLWKCFAFLRPRQIIENH
jgi:hypothetical protein